MSVDLPARGRDKPQTKLKLRVKGGQGSKGPGYTSSRGRLEKHSAGAVEASSRSVSAVLRRGNSNSGRGPLFVLEIRG